MQIDRALEFSKYLGKASSKSFCDVFRRIKRKRFCDVFRGIKRKYWIGSMLRLTVLYAFLTNCSVTLILLLMSC